MTNRGEISRPYHGNSSYSSFIDTLSSRLLVRMLSIRIHKTIIIPLVLYEYETWSLDRSEDKPKID
jgi:hypothetical protein